MLPEKPIEGIEVLTTKTESKAPTLLGGDSTISPIMGRFGSIEAYEVSLLKGNGETLSFRISKQQGEDLISARISVLASQVSQDEIISEEAFQSLIPTYVAEEYQNRLRAMGIPEEQIPKSVEGMIARAKEELIAYRELGKEQIASAAQQIADQILEITGEVFRGNKVRYNDLPDEFKEIVKFHLASFSALAAQHSGISNETLMAQQKVLTLNLMAQEKTRDMIISHFKAVVAAGGDSVGTLIGTLLGSAFGSTRGAAEVAYEKTKEALKKK